MLKIGHNYEEKDKGIKDLYQSLNYNKITNSDKYNKSINLLYRNLDDGSKKNDNDYEYYFGDHIYNHVARIIKKLDIKETRSSELPEGEKPKKENTKLSYIEFDLGLTCSFKKLGEFVTELEKSEKIFTITKIKFSNPVETAKENSLNKDFDMTIRAAILKKEKTKKKKDKK